MSSRCVTNRIVLIVENPKVKSGMRGQEVKEDDDEEKEEEEAGDNLAQEEKSGNNDSDKNSVDKEVTKPSEQVKRTISHYVHYNAQTTHSCFL